MTYLFSPRGNAAHRSNPWNENVYLCGAWVALNAREADEIPFGYVECGACADAMAYPGMHVYLYERADGLVKIGYSRNVVNRIKQLPEGRLLRAVPGGRDLERDLHERFASCRDEGEWFVLSPELKAYIDGLVPVEATS